MVSDYFKFYWKTKTKKENHKSGKLKYAVVSNLYKDTMSYFIKIKMVINPLNVDL